ncbi:glycosyltransferase family 4 protein [Agromyces sp. MMS24-K17]|uniref:glycosyltransferase family 4 protein n=1 Tax=Agromyces sp. MMS24-K17 TaxID=3372850 RepID=UPI003754CA37
MATGITARLKLVATTLERESTPEAVRGGLRERVSRLVGDDAERLWLLLAVTTATLPGVDDVVELQRRVRLDGPLAAVGDVVRSARTRFATRLNDHVEVVGGVMVDADHTARSELATGIQRVVRQTIVHWSTDHAFELVGWDDSYSRLRRLEPAERENAVWGTGPVDDRRSVGRVVVPWEADYVLIELATEVERTARIQALARFSPNRVHVVGHDCVPITTAETVGPGMGGVFAKNLSAVAFATNVATTSIASTAEYRGWRETLGAIGLTGPDIHEVMLPTGVDPEVIDEARAIAEPVDDDDPLLLCVGSHEPRKNHLAILQAAEVLWRDGLRFRLVFVGGNSWNSEEFARLSSAMQAAGRSLETRRGLSDEMLWALYAASSLTLFPSVNEGFGLPVAESLAVGVPVLTSDLGSMKEIADAGGGAILVDPHDDRDIASGIRAFLTDPELRQRLRAEAARREQRSWAEYASELWAYFDLDRVSRPVAPSASA